MKTFKTKNSTDVEKLAERGLQPSRIEDGVSIYEVEEDVLIEKMLKPDVEASTPAQPKTTKEKSKKEKKKKKK